MTIQQPPAPPIQYAEPVAVSQAPSWKGGTAQDLRINDETTNNQSNLGQVQNSQVNVQQNFNGRLEEEWLDRNLSIRPKNQFNLSATSDTRGNAYFTATWTHNFGHGKARKRIIALRETELKNRIAAQNMNATLALETHCVKMAKAGFTSASCTDMIARLPSTAQHTRRPTPKPTTPKQYHTNEPVKAFW